MALKPKFHIYWIVMNAVLISLSASSAVEEPGAGHRCYWCGPLAEQVHRSQRASACIGDRSKVTICEENFSYCAIVAKSPPYVESRYCVKFYQDECFSQYCNTTKTWKITCPCRGELCNGLNTLRENEAFKIIKQNNGKVTHNRSKRRLITDVGFLNNNKNKMNNVTTEEDKQDKNKTDHVKIITVEVNLENETVVRIPNSDDDNTAANITDPPAEINMPDITPVGSSPNLTDSLTRVNDSKKVTNNYEKQINNTVSHDNITDKTSAYNKQADLLNANIMSEEFKTDIIIMSSGIPKMANDAETDELYTNINGHTAMLQTTLSTKPTILESKVMVEPTIPITYAVPVAKTDVSKSKLDKQLPAAEGLKNSSNASTKIEKNISATANDMTNHNDVTTQTVTPQDNSARRIINTHMLTLVIGIVEYYLYV